MVFMPNTITLTKSERMELTKQASSRSGRAEDARRARQVLLLAEGHTWDNICDRLPCSRGFIDSWSKRFAAERVAGLYSRHRGQAASVLTPRLEARILDWTLKRKPTDGSTHWSTRKLGQALGVSHMMVSRVWAKHRLRPHRLERYLTSNDPEFEAKAADVIGLYLNPPAHAAVFCVDEKTAIQALDRLDPVLPLSPGRAARHTSAEFVAFLTDIVVNQPKGKEIHVIADNLSAHKTKRVDAFLAEHRNVHLHFTPTYSSWLNQVELWFAKIERDVIARGVFTSVPDLKRKLMRYIRQYNNEPKPVKWKYFDPSRRISSDSVVTVH